MMVDEKSFDIRFQSRERFMKRLDDQADLVLVNYVILSLRFASAAIKRSERDTFLSTSFSRKMWSFDSSDII